MSALHPTADIQSGCWKSRLLTRRAAKEGYRLRRQKGKPRVEWATPGAFPLDDRVSAPTQTPQPMHQRGDRISTISNLSCADTSPIGLSSDLSLEGPSEERA